jgi:two-component system, OmpR family, sensor histidine kinase KdpD
MKNVLRSVVIMVALLGVATLCALILYPKGIGSENIIMIYLLTVLFCTVFTRSYVFGIASALTAVITFNYYFTEPRHTLLIYSSADITLLAFFFVTAIVAGTIMSRLQQQIELANRNERTSKLLFEISGGFVGITGKENIILRGIHYIEKHGGREAYVRLKDGEEFGNHPQDQALICREYPIKGTGGLLGNIMVFCPKESAAPTENELLIKTVAAQIGVTLDREYLYREREEIRVAMEGEKLRSTLLRAVAHDLRSPLTSLSGAGEMLYENFDKLSVSEQKELSKSISEEMIWLTNIVENILNMTRISEARLILNRDYEVVDDIVGEAVSHMKELLSSRKFSVSLPKDVVEIFIDGKLVSQVLINLLSNAVRYTPADAQIKLEVTADDARVQFSVSDTGKGIDAGRKHTLFKSFSQSQKGITDGQRGMGLGLSICRAVVEAHGGLIWLEDNVPQGSRFIFTLPMEAEDGK